jgi:Concanavalin A-like lectin/glucanases superfamily
LTVSSLPTNSFASYMLGLKPVGYWPLQETSSPAAATIETNYGTLGILGNAYYAVTTTNETNVLFNQQGGLTASGDNNTCVQFGGPSGNNELLVPRLSPKLTLTAPFTMEVWIKTKSLTFSDLISEDGNGLNSAAGGGNWGGPRLCYAGNNGGGPALQLYIANGNGTTRNDVSTPANSLTTNGWNYCVATYDGTNTLLYIDGTLETSSTALGGANAMAIDTSTPLTIGDGLWTGTAVGGQRAYTGDIDEVAIYTNLLSATQIQNHYLSGTTSGSNYMQTVINDSPLLYYRMDSAGYTNTAAASCPDAVNFGSAPVNATYLSGTRPGFVAGPSVLSNSNFVASPIDGVTAGIDAGTNAAFNTTNTEPFTVACWMKGNPGDSHLQGLVTHGVNWALDLVGSSGSVILTNNAGSVASTTIVNDGDWHFVAGVYDGFNNYIYVDGALNDSAGASGTISTDSRDVYLGGDSAYTIVGNNEQYFGGAIAQAAFFTNALTAAQIQGLYQAAVVPGISINPTNIVFSVNGNQLNLSWPADHLGWTLQAQTNRLSVGINTNWVNVSGSSSVTNVIIPINLTNGCVFYRLIY